jgi:hypothetical protein
MVLPASMIMLRYWLLGGWEMPRVTILRMAEVVTISTDPQIVAGCRWVV